MALSCDFWRKRLEPECSQHLLSKDCRRITVKFPSRSNNANKLQYKFHGHVDPIRNNFEHHNA